MMKNQMNAPQSGEPLSIALLHKIIDLLDNLSKKNSPPDLLDNADLKQRYHLSDSSIYRLRQNEKIKYIKLGGKFYYSRQSIEDLLH